MSIIRRLSVFLLVCLWALPASAQTSGQLAGNLNATSGASSCVILPVAGMGTGSVQIVGTWVGTISFTVANTGDAADYKALNMAPSNSSTQVTSSTANGLWSGSVAGYRFFRACMTAYTSGTASLLLSAAATGGGGAGAVSVDLTGSSFSGNSAASATGSAVPATAGYTGISVGGTLTGLTAGQATMANSVPVVIASNQSSLTVLPGNTANTTAWLVTGTGGTFPATQSGTWNITDISGTVSLPTGAATAAKQPALGTAGTASADVLTVQGRASMTPILATLSGTNSIRLQDGSGNALTSLAAGAERSLTVSVVDGSGNQISSFGGSGGTASAFGSTFPSGASSGTAAGFNDGTNMQAGRVVDADTSGGTFYAQAVNSVFRTSGTPVEAGTSSNPWNVVFPSAQAVSGPLTDTQLRATAVPVSGTVTATGPLTDTQLRASAVPISVATIPSHAVTNAGTFAVQATEAGTWTVTGAGGTFPVTDSGGSLTVDAPVGTPVFVRLSDGTAAITTLPVSLASVPSHAVTNAGTFSVQVTSMPADATELPAASALADAMANPTTPLIGAAMMAYNGTTWDRLQPALDYAQNSTTSGQTGSLVQGAVTTSSPTYTSGRTSPVSLDTSGSLRVAVVSGSTGNAAASNTGSAVPTQAGYAGVNVGGTLRGMTAVNPSGSIYATQMDMASVAGATAAVNNGAVDAGTLRVTLANNSTGILATVGTVTTVSTVTNLSQLGGIALPIEDAAETAGGVGIYAMGVRRDTRASSAGTTGDNTMASYDSTGGLWVNPFGITQAAATYLTVRLSDGSNFLTAAADQTEDAAAAGGEAGPMVLSVRRDTAATSAGTDGDFATFNTDASGRLWTIAQPSFAGVVAVAGNGVSGTGVQRVTLASDSTGVLATVSTVTSLSQLGGIAVPVEDAAETAGGTGIYAMGVRRDTPASSAGTTGDNTMASYNNVGALWVSQVDPCSSEAKITDPFSLTARGIIIAAAASKKNYICGITVIAGAAEIFNLDEGTGTTCQTGTAAIAGSTTAANGLSFAANGGLAAIGSNSTVLAGKTANVDTCIVPSGSNRLSGFVTYVQR